jgi:hypothetical protein
MIKGLKKLPIGGAQSATNSGSSFDTQEEEKK